MKLNKSAFVAISISLLAIVIGLFVFLPKSSDNQANSSGSFTKADKYRNSGVENKDIKIRTDFLKDTELAKQVIAEMINYSTILSFQESIIQDYYFIKMQQVDNKEKFGALTNRLKEYSDLVRNNNLLIQNTLQSLADNYQNSKKEINNDIEASMKQVYHFADQYSAKSGVYYDLYIEIDNLLKSKDISKKDNEALKELSDRLLIDNLFIGISLGDTVTMKKSLDKSLYSNSIVASMLTGAFPRALLANTNEKNLNAGIHRLGLIDNIFKLKLVNSFSISSYYKVVLEKAISGIEIENALKVVAPANRESLKLCSFVHSSLRNSKNASYTNRIEHISMQALGAAAGPKTPQRPIIN